MKPHFSPSFARRRRPAPPVRVALLLGLALLASGCGSLFPPLMVETDGRGTLTVGIYGAAAFGGDAVFQVKLARSDRKFDLVQQFPAGETDVVVFQNIAAGRWDVTVHLIEDDVITHTGSGEAYVAGDDSRVDVALAPNNGHLELVLALGDDCVFVGGDPPCLADGHRVGRYLLRPTVQDDQRGDFSWEAGRRTLTVVRPGLPPGSYEYQVAFYDDTRARTNMIFQSDWESFDVLPGRLTQVRWSPVTGSAHVGLVILGPPAPPTDVRVSDRPPALALTWTPPPEPVQLFNVYAKGPGQEWFCKVGEAPGDATGWSAPRGDIACAGLDDAFPPIRFAVTAVNGYGYESLRSNEADVSEPFGPDRTGGAAAAGTVSR